METNIRVEMDKVLKRGDFVCGSCNATNIRVKTVKVNFPVIDVICECNECGEEWTEHFNLEYAGYTNSEGEYYERCPDCGASIDCCTCREDD